MIDRFGILFAVAVGFSSVSTSAWAQAPSPDAAPAVAPANPTEPNTASAPAEGACFVAPAKLPDQEIQAFLQNPASLLTDYGNGGLSLASRVRSLVGSSTDTLTPLIAVAALPPAGSPPTPGGASPMQTTSIGSGLGRAAKTCVVVVPKYAERIQEEVAGSSNEVLITAFRAANSELPTAALGGPAAAPGADITGGNVGVGASGSPGSGGSAGNVNTVSGTFSITSGNRYFASSSNASVATASNGGSVSPTLP